MRTSTVLTNDLALAIRSLGEGLAEGSPANFEVTVEGASKELHPILRDEIYRIAGEALRNAFHHAEAKRIEAQIRYGERELQLRIEDDGKGIDPEVLRAGRTGHFGLPGMRERAEIIGGKLDVWSSLGSGTRIELSVPASRAYQQARRRSLFNRPRGVS